MAATPTYDPGKHFANFAGFPISGYADTTFIEVERSSEAFTKSVGAGGEVCRVRNRDRSATIKFTLMASSPVNDILSAIAIADEANGSGIGVLSIRDSQGTTVLLAGNAWIKKMPKVDFAKELPNRDWELECAVLDIFVGGDF